MNMVVLVDTTNFDNDIDIDTIRTLTNSAMKLVREMEITAECRDNIPTYQDIECILEMVNDSEDAKNLIKKAWWEETDWTTSEQLFDLMNKWGTSTLNW